MRRWLVIFGAGLFLMASTALSPGTGATPRKVTLCHRTVTAYSLRTVSAGTAYRHLDHSMDVIEPFRYRGETYSLNWDAEGQAFLEAGCRRPAPANDLPSGAIALTPGVTETTETGGATVAGEEVTACLGEPPWHSVWYTLEGTGGPVTLDLSSPTFFPVGAVYTRDGDTFTEIGREEGEPVCFFSDEGPFTFPTEAGVTYWIQVGGFSEVDHGTVVLTAT